MSLRRRLNSDELARIRLLLSEHTDASGAVAASNLVNELAVIFARTAVHLSSPAKSFAKRIPYYLSQNLGPEIVRAVIEAANERVVQLRAEDDGKVLRNVQPLLRLDEAAVILRLTPGVMEKLLIDWRFRRDCGWPQWIAGRWYFHPDAFGLRKPAYFGHLPVREPYPPPPHCSPQPEGES